MDKRKTTITTKKVRRLLKVLADKKKILIVSHDNPDPDTLGSAYALCHMFEKKLNARTSQTCRPTDLTAAWKS